MKMTWISDYEAQPGELIEWRLHSTSIAAAVRSELDPRPPSYMQEAHVRTAAVLRNMGIEAPTWLGAAFDVPGALDVNALETALLHWITRHETLRSGLRLAGAEWQRFTLSAEDVSLDRTAGRHFSLGADLLRHLEDRSDEATDPLTWPPYLLATVGRDDGFTVYLAFDHSNVDGYSIVQIPYEIHELYAAAVAGRPARLAKAGSYVDFSKRERDAADDVSADHESVLRWRDFVESCGGVLPAFPLDLGVTPGELPKQTGVCEWLLDSADAKAFGAVCKAADGNFFAGVLAIASIVAYERADQPVYRTVIPFHTRSEEQWATSLGWYIGLAPIEIATARAQDFHELVGMAHEAVRKAKPVAQVPFAKVCRLMELVVRPMSVISYMDGQTVPGARRWRDWKAHGFGKVSYGDEAYLWVNRTVDGLFVTSRYPSTDVGHKNMSAFIERTRELLRLVARSGGHGFERDVALERAVA
jgi:hypothetical protein